MNRWRQRPLKWLVVFVVILLGSGLVACKPATGPIRPTPRDPVPTVTVPVELAITIALAGRFSSQALPVLDEQIAAFEAANPDVRVEVVRARRDPEVRRQWISERLQEADTSLDLFLLDATWPAELAASGGLVILEDHLKALGVETARFLPGAVEANSYEGHLVALPWTADGGLLYYRRDLLAEVGVEPPRTLAELQRIALDIKAREKLPHGYVWQGAPTEDLTCATLEFVWSSGGDLLDEDGNVVFDSLETRAGLEQMRDLVVSGASPRDTAAYDMSKALTPFRNGDAVFLRSQYDVSDYLDSDDSPVAGQVGVTALPASCLAGQSLALSAHSLHPEKALRFMAFLVAYEQQVQMALAANQPPALAAAYEDESLLVERPVYEMLRGVFLGAGTRPSVPEYAELSEAIYTEANKMLAGDQEIEATVANIQRRVESILQ